MVTDFLYAFGSNSNGQSGTVLDNESGNSDQLVHSNVDTIIHGRRRSGFRRRGDTTSMEGPTGAPPLGAVSMVGAAGGGPAAWAAAAFGRGDDRKVCRNYFMFKTRKIVNGEIFRFRRLFTSSRGGHITK